MKILFVYLYCNLGGVATVLKHRIKRLKKLEPKLMFKQDGGGKSEWERQGVQVEILGTHFLDGVVKAAKEGGFDVISVIDTPEVVEPIRKVYQGPLFFEVHTSIPENIEKSTEQAKLCDQIIVPSNWSRDTLGKMGWDLRKISVVPNMMDEESFRYDDSVPETRPPEVLWVGKITDSKNWQESLQILGDAVARGSDLRVKWITGGLVQDSGAKTFLRLMFDHQLAGRIDWIHDYPYFSMPRLYSRAAKSGGLLLSSSAMESFFMVAHEAIRCRLPVLAADVGPLSEYIKDGESGFLYPLHDTSAAVSKLRTLLTDASLRGRMIEAATKSVARYDSAKLSALYERVLSGESTRAFTLG